MIVDGNDSTPFRNFANFLNSSLIRYIYCFERPMLFNEIISDALFLWNVGLYCFLCRHWLNLLLSRVILYCSVRELNLLAIGIWFPAHSKTCLPFVLNI
jgi:hypothetical protein